MKQLIFPVVMVIVSILAWIYTGLHLWSLTTSIWIVGCCVEVKRMQKNKKIEKLKKEVDEMIKQARNEQ